MTQDEIIEMAKQVWGELACTMHIHQIEAFAKLVAEAEREACAKIADSFSVPMCESSADAIAERIRARK